MWWFLIVATLIPSCTPLNFRDYYRNIRDGDVSQVRRLEKEKLLALMNSSVDPCDDFFEYACGGWRTITDFAEVYDIRDKRVKEALSQPEEFYQTKAQKRMKQFYDRCVAEVGTTGRNTSWLGTGVLRRYEEWLAQCREAGNFSWIEVAGTLARQGIEVFFKMDSEWDESKVVPVLKLHLSDKFEASSYMKRWALGRLHYKASEIDVIVRQSEEIYKEVSKNWTQYRRPKYVKTLLGSERSTVLSFAMEQYLSVRFQDRLNKTFILVDRPEEVNEVAAFLNTVHPDLMSAYFLHSIAEFLDTEFFLLDKLDCLGIAQKYFRPPLVDIVSNYYFEEEARQDLAQIIERLKEQQYTTFNNTPWFDETTKQEAFEKVRVVGTELSFKSEFTRKRSVVEDFEKLDLGGGNVFEAIVFSDLIGKKLNALIENELKDGFHIVWFERNPFGAVAGFIPLVGPKVYVPMGIAMPPFYDYRFPYFRKYGGYGTTIAHELMHNFDSNQYKVDSKLKRREWWSQNLSLKFEEDFECIYSVYGEENRERAIRKRSENVADSLGLKTSYNTYKRLLSNGEFTEDEELSGFEDTGLNVDQLFYLSFAQSFCFIEPTSTKGGDFDFGPHPGSRIRVSGTASNSEDFADVFNCPLGSPMNPEKKCSYFA